MAAPDVTRVSYRPFGTVATPQPGSTHVSPASHPLMARRKEKVTLKLTKLHHAHRRHKQGHRHVKHVPEKHLSEADIRKLMAQAERTTE